MLRAINIIYNGRHGHVGRDRGSRAVGVKIIRTGNQDFFTKKDEKNELVSIQCSFSCVIMECPVCYELVGIADSVTLHDAHAVCAKCNLQLPKPRRCPMCRYALPHTTTTPAERERAERVQRERAAECERDYGIIRDFVAECEIILNRSERNKRAELIRNFLNARDQFYRDRAQCERWIMEMRAVHISPEVDRFLESVLESVDMQTQRFRELVNQTRRLIAA